MIIPETDRYDVDTTLFEKKMSRSPGNPIKLIIENIIMFCGKILCDSCCEPNHSPFKMPKSSTELTEQLGRYTKTFREITRFVAPLLSE